MEQQSRRQRLDELIGTGRLRDMLMRGRVDNDVCDMIVDLCVRYCSPRRKSRFQLARIVKGKGE
jgi:hypothetical protein